MVIPQVEQNKPIMCNAKRVKQVNGHQKGKKKGKPKSAAYHVKGERKDDTTCIYCAGLDSKSQNGEP